CSRPRDAYRRLPLPLEAGRTTQWLEDGLRLATASWEPCLDVATERGSGPAKGGQEGLGGGGPLPEDADRKTTNLRLQIGRFLQRPRNSQGRRIPTSQRLSWGSDPEGRPWPTWPVP